MLDPHFRNFSRQSARYLLLWILLASMLDWSIAGTCTATEARLTPIVRAVRDVGPAVVNIQGQKSLTDQDTTSGSRQVNGMGTGVVIDPARFYLDQSSCG